MFCGACNTVLHDRQKADETPVLTCSLCSMKYHLGCLNLSREQLKSLRTNEKNDYRCPACKAKKKERFTESTPVRQGKRGTEHTAVASTVDSPSATAEAAAASIPVNIIESFTQSMMQLQNAFDTMKKEMCSFTSSLTSTSEDMEHFRKEIHEIKKELKDLDRYKAEVTDLRAEVTFLRQELENRTQREFLRDIEITGITEHRGENLPHILSNLTTKLGLNLDPRDVDDIKRIGIRSGSSQTEKPRPVILTLTRRAPRDQLLRAARIRRGISTDMIEVPGNSRRVYINEHLTKINRVLFSKARSTGTQLKFKFVWTSNGNIFMRRTETSSVIRVTSESILEKLLKNSHDANQNS